MQTLNSGYNGGAMPPPSLLALLACTLPVMAADLKPPSTEKDNVTETIHGLQVTDPYRWLEDQDAPRTRAWIDAQMKHTRAILDPLPGRETLRRQLDALLRVERTGIPREAGGRYFYTRRAAGESFGALYMRSGLSGAEKKLIDFEALTPDKSKSGSVVAYSLDGKRLAYQIRKGGEDEVEIRFFDVDAARDLSDRLPRVRWGGGGFNRDASALYFSTGSGPKGTVYRHPMNGTEAIERIFDRDIDAKQYISADVSEDGRWLTAAISEGWGKKTEIHLLSLTEARASWRPLITGIDAEFTGEVIDSRFIANTNWKAPKRRVLAIDLAKPDLASAKELIPEAAATLDGLSIIGGELYASYLENVTTRVRRFSFEGKPLGDLKLPGLGTVAGPIGHSDKREAFFAFTSFTEPGTIYRLDTGTGQTNVWFRTQLPIDPAQFEVKQVWVTSKDKTRVPMFLVHKKGLKLDRERPVFLTGYGGFLVSLQPVFNATAAVWAQNDGVFAVPNLRGGGEFGEAWHQAGMLERKQNVFDDFTAAAEWLIENGYTRAGKIAIEGVSNGGLLVGAALTQRPDLYGAVLCGFPLLDMVRYHKFLLGPLWIPEYGSADDPKLFPVIKAYSPYHNVKPGTKYPAALFITGDSDTRVAPLHARKMAALMQTVESPGKPQLLHYDTSAGHSGGLRLEKQVANLVDELSFAFWQLGVKLK